MTQARIPVNFKMCREKKRFTEAKIGGQVGAPSRFSSRKRGSARNRARAVGDAVGGARRRGCAGDDPATESDATWARTHRRRRRPHRHPFGFTRRPRSRKRRRREKRAEPIVESTKMLGDDSRSFRVPGVAALHPALIRPIDLPNETLRDSATVSATRPVQSAQIKRFRPQRGRAIGLNQSSD